MIRRGCTHLSASALLRKSNEPPSHGRGICRRAGNRHHQYLLGRPTRDEARVAGLPVCPGHVLVDGRRIKDLEITQQPIIKGDAKSQTIAAASILAKKARDALMHDLDAKHPAT